MHEVTVEKTLPAPKSAVEAHLTPAAIVQYEGLYEPSDVSVSGERTTVTTVPSGRLFPPRYVFERTAEGFRYRQESDDGSLVNVETALELTPRDDVTVLRLHSSVSPTVPLPLLGRYAVWRRRRILSKFCTRLAGALDGGDGRE